MCSTQAILCRSHRTHAAGRYAVQSKAGQPDCAQDISLLAGIDLFAVLTGQVVQVDAGASCFVQAVQVCRSWLAGHRNPAAFACMQAGTQVLHATGTRCCLALFFGQPLQACLQAPCF